MAKAMWRIYERNKQKTMTEKETTIYLLKFALEVIEGEGLERSTNRDNWVIGRDIEEHLELLQKENKSDIIDHVSNCDDIFEEASKCDIIEDECPKCGSNSVGVAFGMNECFDCQYEWS